MVRQTVGRTEQSEGWHNHAATSGVEQGWDLSFVDQTGISPAWPHRILGPASLRQVLVLHLPNALGSQDAPIAGNAPPALGSRRQEIIDGGSAAFLDSLRKSQDA